MNDEVRQSQHIKMKPSIVRKAHQKTKEEGKTLGRWIEEAIEEKIQREEREKVKKVK
jgi:predicted HicB family RNase H-like nuclease